MKTVLLYSGLLVAAVALTPSDARAAGAPAAASKPAAAPAPEAPPPRSTFVIDPQFGKDPFFPRSTRLQGVVVKTNAVVSTTSSQFPDEIRVQGVATRPEGILVILNGKSIMKGETVELPIRGQRIPVKCLDVTPKTILLEVNGITRELNLPVAAATKSQ